MKIRFLVFGLTVILLPGKSFAPAMSRAMSATAMCDVYRNNINNRASVDVFFNLVLLKKECDKTGIDFKQMIQHFFVESKGTLSHRWPNGPKKDQVIRSYKNAVGFGQLMWICAKPFYDKYPGMKAQGGRYLRRHNIFMAVQHMKTLLDRHDWNYTLAMQEYNCGYVAMRAHLTGKNKLPSETIRHIKYVMSRSYGDIMRKAKNRSRYGHLFGTFD